MIYTITYFSGSEDRGGDTCNGSFDRAKGLAVAAVEGGMAKRSEVRDIHKQLLFRFPVVANV